MTIWTVPTHNASRPQWLAYARYLAWFTIFYNLLEGLVSMGFGWADDSMALFGFGADSFIEVGSALLVLWRLRGDEVGCASERLQRERRAAMGIGSLFVLLALGTSIGAVFQLVSHHHPETTVPGLLVSVFSLGFMFWLWKSKQRAAKVLDSRSLEGDAACSLACIQLSTVLFAGSLTFLLAPVLWWVDAGAALVLSAFIAREGISSIRASMKPGFTGGCGCHE
jgi:divalent metal cation (Fe/Co/Zn/Cd) transporter